MLQLAKEQETFIYTDEADMLNKIVFGQTAAEWRSANKKLAKNGRNQRDFATVQHLVVLANLENLNAHFISQGKNQKERIQILLESAESQYKSFIRQEEEQEKLLLGSVQVAKKRKRRVTTCVIV